MPYKVITKCPVCDSKLTVTKLNCKKCGTIVENDFEFSKFAYLPEEQLNFIEVFVKSRGNIKDVERELGISYPTVRGRLEEVIAALGYSPRAKEESNSEVIDKLENGEITAEQAINLLKK